MIEGLEASLERLDLKYVDIVYAHRPDRLTPMEETVRAFNYVIEKGMALYWGTSEWSADEIAEACGIAKDLRMIAPIVEQPLYNVLDRTKVEGEFQRLYKRCGLGLTTFSPLKFGLLTGKYNNAATDGPPPGSRFSESKDKFAQFMRENYGGDDWQSQVQKAAKLKVNYEFSSNFRCDSNHLFVADRRTSRNTPISTCTCMVLKESKCFGCYHGCFETGADR